MNGTTRPALDKKADLVGPGIGNYEELEKILPQDYTSLLTPKETQQAIFAVKNYIEENLCKELNLMMVTAPLIVGFSAPIAAAAISFSTYLLRTISLPAGFEYSVSVLGFSIVKLSPSALVAVTVILILSAVHHKGVLFGTRVQNLLTGLKIVVILVFMGLGVTIGRGSISHFGAGLEWGCLFREEFAVSLIFVSFAYSGWNAAAYLGAEIKNPGRNIPLSLFAGTAIVMALYVGLNGIYVFSLSPAQMRGVLEIGAKSAVVLFGEKLGGLFSAAITLGLLSVLSAMIMAGPRVCYAMARDGVFFEVLGKVDSHESVSLLDTQRRIPLYSRTSEASSYHNTLSFPKI
ncbi:MAG: amino acid permease [Thermodesulfobacteriota bacterium]